jgi:uncharacterized protein (DUF1800 family)
MATARIHQKTSARLRKRTVTATIGVLISGALALAFPHWSTATGRDKDQKSAAQPGALKGLPGTDLSENEAILHALNRLAYGPRPGDVERVRQVGLARWIDQQLHPESIDDSAMNARLASFPTLTMSSGKLLSEFPRPAVAAKQEGVTPKEYRKEQAAKVMMAQVGAAEGLPSGDASDSSNAAGAAGAPGQDMAAQDQGNGSGDDAGAFPAKGGKGAKGQGGFGNNMMDYAQMQTPQRIVAELSMAKIDRAVYSERQLYEQMVDFWFNHFNVFAGKGVDRWMLTSYERDAIRPHAMGKFRDLLEATAKSPAMLFYLDNWQSVDPAAWARLQEEQQLRTRRFRAFGGPLGVPGAPGNANAQKKKQERGLNENYGREIMELHTLGVDGGYTQQDVTEVARSFTGWTIRTPQKDPQFWFNDRLHDDKPKMVLGHKIDAGVMKDGEEVLDILSRDPHTAHHLAFEIAQHFVSDNPPEALVERMSQTYLASDGDIRAVLHTMIYSPEFWSRDAYQVKIKTPLELVASAARAVGADVSVPLPMVQWTARIGEPLYQCQPPTGYSEKAADWVNTGALLNRLNYSLTLTSGRMRGTQVDVATVLGTGAARDPQAVLDRAIASLLSGQVSAETRQTLEKRMSDPQILQASLDDPVKEVNQGMVAGLVLGAPEFQRR